jgi:hypothetical protein
MRSFFGVRKAIFSAFPSAFKKYISDTFGELILTPTSYSYEGKKFRILSPLDY